jgi:predicted nucleic acid-binding protein
VILTDTGPLVALFDPRDDAHSTAQKTLAHLEEELVTTVPVLTEVFHLLGPSSRGSRAVRAFVTRGGLKVWWLTERTFARALRLMEEYEDQPMDLADASLVAAAEVLRTTRVFTIDRRDFLAYRARIGKKARGFTLV